MDTPNYSGFVSMTIRRVKDSSDTGFQAVMRRADNPNQCSGAWEFLVPFCDIAVERQRLAFALVGAAIARAKPDRDGSASVGKALRSICGADADAVERESRRLRRLIACDTTEELIPVLRPILNYIQSNGGVIGYERLLRELLFWNEKTRIAWTRDFYRKSADAAPEPKREAK